MKLNMRKVLQCTVNTPYGPVQMSQRGDGWNGLFELTGDAPENRGRQTMIVTPANTSIGTAFLMEMGDDVEWIVVKASPLIANAINAMQRPSSTEGGA